MCVSHRVDLIMAITIARALMLRDVTHIRKPLSQEIRSAPRVTCLKIIGEEWRKAKGTKGRIFPAGSVFHKWKYSCHVPRDTWRFGHPQCLPVFLAEGEEISFAFSLRLSHFNAPDYKIRISVEYLGLTRVLQHSKQLLAGRSLLKQELSHHVRHHLNL